MSEVSTALQTWMGDRTLWALESALRGVSARHETILNNLANLETPGYRRQDVVFRDELRRALTYNDKLQPVRTHERHLTPAIPALGSGNVLQPRRITSPGTPLRADGNTVSPDQEMALLSANALEEQALIRLAAGRLAALRTVINEGRR